MQKFTQFAPEICKRPYLTTWLPIPELQTVTLNYYSAAGKFPSLLVHDVFVYECVNFCDLL